MRRPLIALVTGALAASVLAFAPAAQQATTTHTVTFDADGAQTVAGGVPGGINLTGFTEGTVRCSSDPDAYCETILVTVEQPVADTDPEQLETATGDLSVDVTSDVPGGDFDLYVYTSDADAKRGPAVANSGNAPGCAQLCGTAPDPAGLFVNQCDGTDECVDFKVSTSDLPNGGTKHFLVEVVYFAAPATYTAEFVYDGPDAAAEEPVADTTTEEGTTQDGEAGAPADTVAPIDVTGGFEKVGDWGGGGNNAAVGAALGQDLEAAFIGYADETFTFVIDLASLPPVGGTPEVTRYGWSFRYNDLELELDGKFSNYSRGTCDPTAGTCPPPRDPGLNQFLLRGNCYQDTSLPMTLTLCEELANVQATFDPADGTITVPIPASALAPDGVQACDEIVGLNSFIGQSVWSAPSAFVTNTAMPYDDALHYIPLVVPYADPTLSCGA